MPIPLVTRILIADDFRSFARAARRCSMPNLEGRIGAMAIRAPIPVGSIVDLVVEVSRHAAREDVNADIVGSPHSCVFDSQLTMSEGPLVKVFGWYDNEWGYSCRPVDLVARLRRSGIQTDGSVALRDSPATPGR